VIDASRRVPIARSKHEGMEQVAFVFPGQGSQYVGMGLALAETSPAARTVFEEADDALGSEISELAWRGPAEGLDLTVNAQPAILATSIAYLRTMEARRADDGAEPLVPAFCAGHSMGQFSAMVAAGTLSFPDAIRLVTERGRLMQASAPGKDGAMAAMLGLDAEALPEVLAAGSRSGIVVLANDNAPGQVVISGERPAVVAAIEMARSRGARKAIVLPVSVAAHSPLMDDAAHAIAQMVDDVPFADPKVPLLANGTAALITTGDAARHELVEHLTTGVAWTRTVRAMQDAGVTRFLEVGPGRVLSALIRRIAPEAEAHALDDASAPGRLALPAWALSGAPASTGSAVA
jgi:[acyl-carrier-protein] S-malonyltransferase